MLAQRVPMADAELLPGLVAEVGFFDLQDSDRFCRVGQTSAWNWQMGAQLQWLDGAPGRQLIYNRRTDDATAFYPHLGATLHDVDSGEDQTLPMPVYVLAPNSAYGLCVNYRRLYITHQTIGYSDAAPQPPLPEAPADDGIHRMDLRTGQTRLILSYADLRNFQPKASMDKAIHWVSHIEINPRSSRVLLHRWTERVKDETCFLHRLITLDPDGSGLRLLECSDHPLPQLVQNFDPGAVGAFDYEKSEHQISHPMWRDDEHIIVWGPHSSSIHYHLHHGGEVRAIGAGVLTENGHMTFSPVARNWLLSDTYPDVIRSKRILFLYDTESGLRYDLGSFHTAPCLKKENRCDLHPRWSRDGRLVCIDSIHGGERQMYLIDVSALTAGALKQPGPAFSAPPR